MSHPVTAGDKRPWSAPGLRRLELTEQVLDALAPSAKTPEQRRQIAELRKTVR